MKKFFTSKPFMVTALASLCVVIAAVCFFVSRDNGAAFVPEPPQQSESADEWKESGGGATQPATDVPKPTQEQEAYPKVVQDDGKDVVIDFTPPKSSETEAPEIPAGKTEIEQPKPKPEVSHPVTPDTSVKPPEQKPKEPSGPAPGSTNDKGQVYDPAFGWVTLSPVEQIPTDNDGDLNKAVGSMD